MKPTKLQRHTAYIIMLAEMEGSGGGFCLWMELIFDFGNGGSDMIIKKYLPELYNKKPKHSDAIWFDLSDEGNKKRCQLLKQCIKETA